MANLMIFQFFESAAFLFDASLQTTSPRIDPGTHVVRAAAPGFVTSEATVTLAEGKTEEITLTLEPK